MDVRRSNRRPKELPGAPAVANAYEDEDGQAIDSDSSGEEERALNKAAANDGEGEGEKTEKTFGAQIEWLETDLTAHMSNVMTSAMTRFQPPTGCEWYVTHASTVSSPI